MLSEALQTITVKSRKRSESWPRSSIDCNLERLCNGLQSYSLCREVNLDRKRSRIDRQYILDEFVLAEDSGQSFEEEHLDSDLGEFSPVITVNPLDLSESELEKFSEIRQKVSISMVSYNQLSKAITSGSLAAIIKLIIQSSSGLDIIRSKHFLYSFLWTYDFFMKPQTFLQILIIYYRAPVLPFEDVEEQQRRIIRILIEWITLHCRTLSSIKHWTLLFFHFIQYIAISSKGDTHGKWLRKAWDNAHFEYHKSLAYSVIETRLGLNPNLLFTEIPPQSLAQQLTLIEQVILQNISLLEYRTWATASYSKKVECVNIKSTIDRFNDVSFWTATTVLMGNNNKERINIISHWVAIMKELYTLKNFQSLMPIYLGLTLHSIQLLKVWKSVPKNVLETLEQMGQLFTQCNNYSSYRRALSTIEKPYIPLQAVIMKDLSIIQESKTMVSTGIINWAKLSHLGKALEDLRDSRLILYPIKEDTLIQQFFLHEQRKILTEDEIYEKIKGSKLGEDEEKSKKELIFDSLKKIKNITLSGQNSPSNSRRVTPLSSPRSPEGLSPKRKITPNSQEVSPRREPIFKLKRTFSKGMKLKDRNLNISRKAGESSSPSSPVSPRVMLLVDNEKGDDDLEEKALWKSRKDLNQQVGSLHKVESCVSLTTAPRVVTPSQQDTQKDTPPSHSITSPTKCSPPIPPPPPVVFGYRRSSAPTKISTHRLSPVIKRKN